MTSRPARCAALALLLLLAPLGGAAEAAASGRDGGEVRGAASCRDGGRAELRLRADDGRIRVRLRIDAARSGAWRVALVQERRVVWRGTRRAEPRLEVERSLRDLPGADHVRARAWGPRGAVCAVSATLPA